MNLQEMKTLLNGSKTLRVQLPNGGFVPGHFHVSEIGKIQKTFIDCGGTVRSEVVTNFKLWNANDYDHRLFPDKLQRIIAISEETLDIDDRNEVQVEYQGQSIEKYGLAHNGAHFILTAKKTYCLAKDQCGIAVKKAKIRLPEMATGKHCGPNSGCC